MASDSDTADFIANMSRKYLWWDCVGGVPHSEDRILAQAMNFATFNDTLLLERKLGTNRLVELMKRAEPGWFSDRSWEFWRGRLSWSTGETIPEQPPRRAVHA